MPRPVVGGATVRNALGDTAHVSNSLDCPVERAEQPLVRQISGIRLGAATGWPALSWCWWRVIEEGAAPSHTMVLGPLLLAVLTVALTSWWVRHNQAIYRRKGPRRRVASAPLPYLTDRLDRPLRVENSNVRTARHVVVDVGYDGAKNYRAVS